MTSAPGNPWLNNWYVPTVLLAVTLTVAAGIWWLGARAEAGAREQR
jgi:hypothetical protein